MGKRISAFTPYQRQEINSISSTNVFTNAPFKIKSKLKQSSTNEQKKTMINDIESKQHDDYF
jgi:hypothetical protein